MIKKLTSATSNIKKYLEDEDLLEDTLIETQQAIEMADIYGNIPLHDRYLRIDYLQQPEQHQENSGSRYHCHVHSNHDLFGLRMNFKDNEPAQWRTPCLLADHYHRLCPDRVSRRLPHP